MRAPDESHPANRPVLATLAATATRRGKQLGPFATADRVKSPYTACDCHPDAVEWVWNRLGATLPEKGYCLVCGRPALVHPHAGVLLAVCLGTAYCLRVP